MKSRRDFIGTVGLACAFAATRVKGAVRETDPGRERMRFGVLSDVHISTHRQLPYFEKTLRKLDEWKVDAVLACGDLADYALRPQLKLVADTWFKVFPNGNGSDGRPVANLMHYGDHDMQDDRYVDYEDAVKEWPDKAFRHAEVIRTLGAKTEHEMVSVSFPPATAVTPRADDYEVTVEMKEREVERVFLQKRVYSSRYLFAEKMDDQPVICLFARDELPDGWPVRFTVRPLNAFGAKGAPIQTGFAPLSAIRRPKGDVLSGNAHIGEAASRRLG